MTDARPHERIHRWTPPIKPPMAGRSGLDYFCGLVDGTIAPQPIATTLGWTVVAAERGLVQIELPVGAHLFHGGAMVHGGVLAALIDSVASGAVMTALEAGSLCATVNLNVQYLAAVREETTLTAVGRLIERSRRTAVADATVLDAAGMLRARGTATLLVTEPK